MDDTYSLKMQWHRGYPQTHITNTNIYQSSVINSSGMLIIKVHLRDILEEVFVY